MADASADQFDKIDADIFEVVESDGERELTIKDGGVTYDKVKSVAAVTATADGTGTGAIPSGTTFATVTSAAATNQVALPAISADTIGQEILIFVGSNGFELITPAASGNTLNGTDGDGTNQLDVAASTLLRCVQVSATGWYVLSETASAVSVVAADND